MKTNARQSIFQRHGILCLAASLTWWSGCSSHQPSKSHAPPTSTAPSSPAPAAGKSGAHEVVTHTVRPEKAKMSELQMREPLNKAMMGWFAKHEFKNHQDAKDPRIELVNANLRGLPPTTIITAQIDPLRSSGERLAEKLKAAGVEVNFKNYDGVAHEFFGMGAVLEAAKDATRLAANDLKKSFGRSAGDRLPARRKID